jgi:hypothetical protein
MNPLLKCAAVMAAAFWICMPVLGQESPVVPGDESKTAVDAAAEEIDDVVKQVDQSQQAQEVKSNILKPIYLLAESFSFPAFHWLAFAVMVTGVVSLALQFVFGQLVVLSRVNQRRFYLMHWGWPSVSLAWCSPPRPPRRIPRLRTARLLRSAPRQWAVCWALCFIFGVRDKSCKQSKAGGELLRRRRLPPISTWAVSRC